MRSNDPQSVAAGETVETKMIACVKSLHESAQNLKTALVARDSDAIWDALGEQEEQAALLNEYSTLWQQMTADADSDTTIELAEKRRRIRLDMKRLQALQRANSMLAQSFLSAVRKAIRSVSEPAAKSASVTYSKSGRQRPHAASRLVRRFG